MIRYFITTYIGPRHIIEHENPIIVFPNAQPGNYGANVDQFVRNWIIQDNLMNRDALFRPEVINAFVKDLHIIYIELHFYIFIPL